jgi:hypothetical protein
MKTTLALLLTLITFLSSSQQIEVVGKVLDSQTNKPLFGVNITVSDTTIGTSTNEEGIFHISVSKNNRLTFNYLGYQKYVLKASLLTKIIKLKRSEKIEKVVIKANSGKQELDIDSKEFDPSLNLSFTDTEEHLIARTSNRIISRRFTSYYSMLPERAGLKKFATAKPAIASDAFAKWRNEGVITFDERDKDITGSPYLNKEFLDGKIYLADQKTILLIKLRFNVLKNQFEAKVGDTITGVNKNQIEYIEVNKRLYKTFYDNSYKSSYFEIIGSYNKTYLLRYDFAKKNEDIYIEGISIGNHTERISKFSKYFIKKPDSDVLIPFKLKKKYLKKLFSNDKRILNYISDHKLKMKNEADFKRVFNYYYNLK